MAKEIRQIGVLTSGGDSPGMNAAIRAVAREAMHNKCKVIGIQRGYKGLLNEEFKEMKSVDVAGIIQMGGTILGTARCPEFKEEEVQQKAADICRKHGIDGIVVMGRHAGYIALWCGIANGAEDILIPEKYDYDEQKIVDHIIINRRLGKKHHLIINAEGIGHSTSMARRIEAATGIETRATILGYMQRGGSPTCKDRYYASIMGAYAADILVQGKTNRVVCYRNGQFVDLDIEEALAMTIEEALAMTKNISEYEYQISQHL